MEPISPSPPFTPVQDPLSPLLLPQVNREFRWPGGGGLRSLAMVLGLCASLPAAELPDLKSIPADLQVPGMGIGAPAPGRRVKQTTPGWQTSQVHHALYLPENWKPGGKYPVLVEFAGNGGYTNKFGDVCNGTVEGCNLGYGISGGHDYLWVCLPFVENSPDGKRNARNWWGDADETAAYCLATMRWLAREFGADTNALVLGGFSRGSIACNYIGLRNDEIAPLWKAFICHSHYDGVRTNWPYADADRVSALTRLQRLANRPQFISHEGSTEATRRYLEETGVQAPFMFVDLPFRNHSDQWVLRDCEPRRKIRIWLRSLGLPAPPAA